MLFTHFMRLESEPPTSDMTFEPRLPEIQRIERHGRNRSVEKIDEAGARRYLLKYSSLWGRWTNVARSWIAQT
ncbi:hypothetical protein [Paraburkholderia azotifigens]|uniref:Uncharacterized protein n=1 Tax=Paraburkholderia azotifigens TaxID=2057004 RepID=A0ABU9QZU3_9BURK